jgi:hypothetical protein
MTHQVCLVQSPPRYKFPSGFVCSRFSSDAADLLRPTRS